MGIDWEELLDADGEDLEDAYEDSIEEWDRQERPRAKPIPDRYARGFWNGNNIRFNRIWGNHFFSDQEVKRLLAGETIEFNTTTKDGRPFKARGKLTNREYNGKFFVGFTLI